MSATLIFKCDDCGKQLEFPVMSNGYTQYGGWTTYDSEQNPTHYPVTHYEKFYRVTMTSREFVLTDKWCEECEKRHQEEACLKSKCEREQKQLKAKHRAAKILKDNKSLLEELDAIRKLNPNINAMEVSERLDALIEAGKQ